MVLWQQILIPPMVGGIVGYFTNSLAVRMLFHPVEPVFVFGKQLPFTPGLVPAEQDRLATKISQLIVDTLLTPEDFQTLAQRLLTPERVHSGVVKASTLALQTMGEPERFERLTQEASLFLERNIQHHLPELTQMLVEKNISEDKIEALFNPLMDGVIQNFHISPDMAQMISSQLIQSVLSPENLRLSLIGLLTPRNIKAIDDLVKDKATGRYGILLFFVNVSETLTKLRTFLNTEPERSLELLEEVTDMMHLEDMIYRGILSFHPDKLPAEQVALFKHNLIKWLVDYIKEHQKTIVQALLEKTDIQTLLYGLLQKLQPENLPEDTLHRLQHQLSEFILNHIEQELFQWVDKLLKVANIQDLIAQKIRDFSPLKMEAIILDVSKKELNMIVILGGVLGVLIGGLQSLLLVLL